MRSVCHVDLTDPAVREQWYFAYDRMRNEAPMYLVLETGEYILSQCGDFSTGLPHGSCAG